VLWGEEAAKITESLDIGGHWSISDYSGPIAVKVCFGFLGWLLQKLWFGFLGWFGAEIVGQQFLLAYMVHPCVLY
jgi:hypothetical protein